jgi:hypothetical protein
MTWQQLVPEQRGNQFPHVKDISSPQLDMCSTVKSPTPISSQDEDKT